MIIDLPAHVSFFYDADVCSKPHFAWSLIASRRNPGASYTNRTLLRLERRSSTGSGAEVQACGLTALITIVNVRNMYLWIIWRLVDKGWGTLSFYNDPLGGGLTSSSERRLPHSQQSLLASVISLQTSCFLSLVIPFHCSAVSSCAGCVALLMFLSLYLWSSITFWLIIYELARQQEIVSDVS